MTETFDHVVAADGEHLPYRRVSAPADRLRARVIYLHGIQSHGGWYVETAAELARRGYDVLLPDRRGSGATTGPRGWFTRRTQLVDDVARLLDLARAEEPQRPVVLIGGCWGARTAIALALREQARLDGLALICPAIKPKVDLPPPDKLRVLLGTLVAPRRLVRVPLTPEMFTANPPYLEFIRTDPLTLRAVSARCFWETFRWDRELARRQDLTLPLLMLRADDDPIVDGPATQRWFEGLASTRKRAVVYDGFGHILDFEPDRQRYWDDLVDWLDATTAAAAPQELVT